MQLVTGAFNRCCHPAERELSASEINDQGFFICFRSEGGTLSIRLHQKTEAGPLYVAAGARKPTSVECGI